MVVNRFDVFMVGLDPAVGSEIQKTRPCLVVSPDEMNENIRTVIVAPMTSATNKYPTRISCRFRKKTGQIALDQIRTIDKSQLIGRLGTIDSKAQLDVVSVLQRMFAF